MAELYVGCSCPTIAIQQSRRDCGRGILAVCALSLAPVLQVHYAAIAIYREAIAWRVHSSPFVRGHALMHIHVTQTQTLQPRKHAVQMSVGAEVVRGPDWPPSCNVDGGGRGRVTSFQADGMVVVQWAKAPTPYKHRWGAHSCFDLSLVFAAAGTPAYPGQPFRPPFRPGAPPRPRPPFSAAYPRPSFNAPFNPRAPPRPHPAYPRPGPRAYPNPSQLPGVVPKSLYRCVGGHNLQVMGKLVFIVEFVLAHLV